MNAAELISDLDAGLALTGEDMTLRRPVGTGNDQTFVPVTVRGRPRVAAAFRTEGNDGAGIASEFDIVLSPTGINKAKWPGGTVTNAAPLRIDPGIPVAGLDQLIARGRIFQLIRVEPLIVAGAVVRLNIRVKG